MSEEVPAEEGPATFFAKVEAAVRLGSMADYGSGLDEEVDDYDRLLTSLGRTCDEDERIAIHEAGHAVCARLLGHEVGGVTVNQARGSEGLCWGAGHAEAFTEGAAMPPMSVMRFAPLCNRRARIVALWRMSLAVSILSASSLWLVGRRNAFCSTANPPRLLMILSGS
ncbi:M50 family metallopeptidase [Bradyrhizobium sp. 6(2017)]|uniref:M50 family metallopeptidase n=1 Tax=Bradyrhizobium sp. 6(2017) TaxID=1197460 RepID=UPI0013E11724|nr:M50 family metallopeptidase [Bradyrhizobium sp. 6(2017)]QIG96781.1 hypothetical protein G6P99_33170 [Bradyrhizobium sp. 6(2017)]